jgi:hypothetical protein
VKFTIHGYRGNKVAAIKEFRQATRCDLKTAKDSVEGSDGVIEYECSAGFKFTHCDVTFPDQVHSVPPNIEKHLSQALRLANDYRMHTLAAGIALLLAKNKEVIR